MKEVGRARGREKIPEKGGESMEEKLDEVTGKRAEGGQQISWRRRRRSAER